MLRSRLHAREYFEWMCRSATNEWSATFEGTPNTVTLCCHPTAGAAGSGGDSHPLRFPPPLSRRGLAGILTRTPMRRFATHCRAAASPACAPHPAAAITGCFDITPATTTNPKYPANRRDRTYHNPTMASAPCTGCETNDNVEAPNDTPRRHAAERPRTRTPQTGEQAARLSSVPARRDPRTTMAVRTAATRLGSRAAGNRATVPTAGSHCL
ncbi:hypothetical protein GCM10009827_080140 [Dactylosporangium maewongense]|uniref:Uncharacterized protein n=1 Tax=Dactylosporangium maewongense TaxID=634393 RepID=A0ABP4MRD9_9ACTN